MQVMHCFSYLHFTQLFLSFSAYVSLVNGIHNYNHIKQGLYLDFDFFADLHSKCKDFNTVNDYKTQQSSVTIYIERFQKHITIYILLVVTKNLIFLDIHPLNLDFQIWIIQKI